MSLKTIGHLFFTTSSFVHHFKSINEVKLELQSGNAQFESRLAIFVMRDLDIWWMTLKNNRAPLLYYIKICAAFHSYWYIKTGVTVRKCQIRVKIGDFFVPRDLENWQMTLKNNRAPLVCCFKLCASFHSHWWIQTGVTVRKRRIWVKISDFLPPCDLEIWQMTLINNRAPLLSSIKLIYELKLELRSGNG